MCHTKDMTNYRQVTVFGANGRVGQLVVAGLLRRGYLVVAAVHNHSHLPTHDNLSVVPADIYDAASVERALEGSDAVISTLGSWGTKRKDILTAGMQHIIPAMEKQQITRIISLTGADARAAGDKMGVVHRLTHLALNMVAPKILRDGEQHITLLEQSQLDWTIVRSPIMSKGKSVGRGVLSTYRPLPWQRISYQYVAETMICCLEKDEWVRQAPYIS
jgi:putative NADH-flavin reductase